MDARPLSPTFAVAPQIALADLADLRDAGFTTIVNNRPDGEDPAAPQGAEVEAAATALGLPYHAIPIGHAGMSAFEVAALDAAIAAAPGRVLAYCRSGTRSAYLWALRELRAGRTLDAVEADAAAAGYELSALRSMAGR